MTASDHLSGQQFHFFHGTASEFQPGEVIHPHESLHGPSTGGHVYVTSRGNAQEYAHFAMEQLEDTGRIEPHHSPRVYEVQPLGPVEEDPAGMREDDGSTDDRRTTHAKVVRQIWPEK